MASPPGDDAGLAALIDAALAGARAAMAVYQTDFSVDRKVDDSPVSEADRASEREIVARLGEAMPGVPIIAEEASAAGEQPVTGAHFLLVDPLDGTKEFISRNGEFTVNIAVIEDGVPVTGVVIAPALRLVYAGGAGRAFKSTIGEALDATTGWSSINVRPAVEHPIAVASRSHMNAATATALKQAACGEHRSIGSSLKFCLVAEGSADFYPRLGPTMEWDTAAGDAVLRAAGGTVVTLEGSKLHYGKVSVERMRPFENPHFLAVGDASLFARLDLVSLK
jgi:3'(2'),5'-bisphosphate nucleotidase